MSISFDSGFFAAPFEVGDRVKTLDGDEGEIRRIWLDRGVAQVSFGSVRPSQTWRIDFLARAEPEQIEKRCEKCGKTISIRLDTAVRFGSTILSPRTCDECWNAPELKEGDRVRHEILGEGVISSRKPNTLDVEAGLAFVEFPHGRSRWVCLNLLTKVDEPKDEDDGMVGFPYDEGDVTVLGPECFVARDGSVLNWRGINYVPQSEVELKSVVHECCVELSRLRAAGVSTDEEMSIAHQEDELPDEVLDEAVRLMSMVMASIGDEYVSDPTLMSLARSAFASVQFSGWKMSLSRAEESDPTLGKTLWDDGSLNPVDMIQEALEKEGYGEQPEKTLREKLRAATKPIRAAGGDILGRLHSDEAEDIFHDHFDSKRVEMEARVLALYKDMADQRSVLEKGDYDSPVRTVDDLYIILFGDNP